MHIVVEYVIRMENVYSTCRVTEKETAIYIEKWTFLAVENGSFQVLRASFGCG